MKIRGRQRTDMKTDKCRSRAPQWALCQNGFGVRLLVCFFGDLGAHSPHNSWTGVRQVLGEAAPTRLGWKGNPSHGAVFDL